MNIPDPGLDAAVERRDLDAVVGRLADRFAIPDGVPDDVDDESRESIRGFLRDNLDGIVPADLRDGEAS